MRFFIAPPYRDSAHWRIKGAHALSLVPLGVGAKRRIGGALAH